MMPLPFRYKLTLILVTMVVLLVVVLDYMSLRNIESRFRILIDQNLQQTQRLVNQRLEDGYDQLYASAVSAASLPRISELLEGNSLSDENRNGIVTQELLPNLIAIDFMAVLNTDAKERGIGDVDRGLKLPSSELLERLLGHRLLDEVLAGEAAVGHVFIDDVMMQIVAVPIISDNKVRGCVLLGKHFSQAHLETISDTVDAMVGIVEDKRLVMSSQSLVKSAFSQHLRNLGTKTYFTYNTTTQAELLGERFLIRHTADDNRFFPDYVVAKSLDAELLFVDGIRVSTLLVSGIAVLVSLLLSLLVAAGISRPIERLRLATKAVADENFSHRVGVTGRDEFATLGNAFNHMMQGLQEKEVIRETLDKSVSREIAAHLLDNGAVLGGESVESSVLFADIRGFTALSERLTEAELIELLNLYFSKMNHCILSRKGVIDKFIGDAVMAIFGAPIKTASHALYALQAAVDMISALDVFNADIGERYGCQLRIGVGINTGTVVAGLVGSQDRMNYTVLGDQVNIASRIEGLSKYYGVSLIITDATLQQLPTPEASEQWCFRYLDHVQVKGRSSGLAIYEPLTRTGAVEAMLVHYERAMAAMQSSCFSEAIEVLSTLLGLYPDDGASRLLMARCEAYRQAPSLFSAEYQAGVRIFDHK